MGPWHIIVYTYTYIYIYIYFFFVCFGGDGPPMLTVLNKEHCIGGYYIPY